MENLTTAWAYVGWVLVFILLLTGTALLFLLRLHVKEQERNYAADRTGRNQTLHDLQSRVEEWMSRCFGFIIAGDVVERNYRFIEEALELVQACGMSKSDVLKLVDYVYSRPVGNQFQEVGGVFVTLSALCSANDIDLHTAASIEIDRINEVDVLLDIREKQKNKPNRSSSLPN